MAKELASGAPTGGEGERHAQFSLPRQPTRGLLTVLSLESLPRVQDALRAAGLDGWLLYDFHGANPIAAGVLALEGMVSRRVFALIPATGVPVAITHAIEQGPWRRWPGEWDRRVYSSWRTLEDELGSLVRGRRVAMEYSAGDAVPYLDRVPAGVLEMVRSLGGTVVTSAELVSAFYAVWSEPQLQSHRRAAEAIAAIAHETVRYAGVQARNGEAATEHELQARILAAFERAGLETDHGPIVAADQHAANPHYSPSADHPHAVKHGAILLVDLWAREPNGGVYADQTWMASLGTPGARAGEVWRAIRDGRDAAISLIRDRVRAGNAVRGGDADDAARAVISERGFGEYFTHRTGHSIDPRSLHGAGPHIDNLETREERVLSPGVGFSIEPGIYVPGEIGMRTEVNVHVGTRDIDITPSAVQQELLIV